MPSALPEPIYKNVIRYLGDAVVPQDVLRRRRQSQETMRRMGTPVLVKHMFTVEDVEKGIAEPSVSRDSIYQQPTHDDPFSYGVGFVSVERAKNEWIVPGEDPETEESRLVIGDKPNEEAVPAPLYRGYGPGYLTYVILPDHPEDVWKLTEEGSFIRTQQAKVILPWFPHVGDNDLLITCEIDGAERVLQTFERYQLKMVSPISMRGRDRQGRREADTNTLTAGGNRHLIQHECEANKVPETDPIYQVETDR